MAVANRSRQMLVSRGNFHAALLWDVGPGRTAYAWPNDYVGRESPPCVTPYPEMRSGHASMGVGCVTKPDCLRRAPSIVYHHRLIARQQLWRAICVSLCEGRNGKTKAPREAASATNTRRYAACPYCYDVTRGLDHRRARASLRLRPSRSSRAFHARLRRTARRMAAVPRKTRKSLIRPILARENSSR